MIELSIIIVTYNSEKQIGFLLDSIYKDKGKIILEVIVLDNHSADTSFTIAKNHKTKPICIQMGSNTGFSFAVNRGLEKAKGEYLLVLNPDTVVQKGTLKKLLDFAKNTSTFGAVAPRLLNPDGKPQASVFRFPTIGNALKYYFFGCSKCFNKYLPENHLQTVEVAVMAAFLISRTTYEIVGKLNEKYFMYYEDIDYCRRLHELKLPVYYLPSAEIKHVHGASGQFTTHLSSPLLSSARLYHGVFYSDVLNFILWAGQKWQKLIKHFF